MAFACTGLEKFARGAGVLESDGTIGIPVRYTVLFDSENFPLKKGFGGTPIMIYVVNTNTERIGTLPDGEILSGMLQRGFAAVVLDYAGSEKAACPALDWSVQGIRQRIMKGDFLSDTDGFGEGKYPETLVVPAGYDVSFGNVYWEFDKHGADGTLAKIVEIWNNDFRGTNADKLIRWTDADGKRKATQCAPDGSEPVWCDAEGNPSADGAYLHIGHTLAEDITDCVRADGSPLDLKLYMHLIYPTKPAKKVPVMCLAGSSECLCAGSATPDRPHLNGFLFSGYAGVLFDYGYTPMARNDHYGYFDGYPRKGYVTGDNCTYSLKHYNDFSDTAAMRFIRYLALSDDRFCLDTDAIGVYGNSKGGWMSFLGEENPDAMPPRRMFPGHHGETRFDNGDTETRGIINGGEEQPWLTWGGKKIFGGANLIYSGCGATYFAISRGHSPLFVACNRRDESCFSTSNAMVNLGRMYDIPTMWLEIPLGHTLVHDDDLLYGTDSYRAFFRFADYFLKKDAVCAVAAKVNKYDFPVSVTVLFSGSADAAEAAKITVRDGDGNALAGRLTSAYGGIEWTFTPDIPVYGGGYTLQVPADLRGTNGKTVQSPFSYAVDFGAGETVCADAALQIGEKGDRRYAAFLVENDGVNTVGAYLSDGRCIGSVNTSGRGWYRIDVTDLGALSGETLTLRAEKPAGVRIETSALTLSGNAIGGESIAPDGCAAGAGTKAVMVQGFKTCTRYPTEEFYSYPAGAVSCGSIIGGEPLGDSDVGRRFRIRFKVYDTVSRYIGFGLNHCSHRPSSIADYRRVICNEITRAGEWTEYSLDYTVYEPLLGEIGRQKKSFYITCFGGGNADSPIYFADLRCEETVTDVVIGKKCVVYEYSEKPLQLGESEIECPKSPWSK
ncbi:MAG: hypothetical protein E7662_10030 [Ruminococcaceae bacterium]|nr:hypothetical protein [Oscillospiraceae bacterium]